MQKFNCTATFSGKKVDYFTLTGAHLILAGMIISEIPKGKGRQRVFTCRSVSRTGSAKFIIDMHGRFTLYSRPERKSLSHKFDNLFVLSETSEQQRVLYGI
jgi:hypothetical protein